jgi:hypothetical protein
MSKMYSSKTMFSTDESLELSQYMAMILRGNKEPRFILYVRWMHRVWEKTDFYYILDTILS